MVGIVTSCSCLKDDGVDEVQMPLVIYKNIAVNGIKDVMLTIGVIGK